MLSLRGGLDVFFEKLQIFEKVKIAHVERWFGRFFGKNTDF